MFDEIPIRAWLLLIIGLWAWLPGRYVFRHLRSSAATRDITRPQEDLSWRTSQALLRSTLALVALGAAAIFIFTPFAEQMAKGPRFFPSILAAFGAWAIYTVARGFFSGKIQPFSKGASAEYDRQTQPKRFWASLIWNAVLGCTMLWGSFMENKDASAQSKEDRCFGDDINAPLQSRNEACPELIAIYTSAIRDDPSDYSARFNRALAYDLLGKGREAIAAYSEAIRMRPTDGDAYLNRGLMHLNAMNYDLALADFDRAHQLDPKNAYPLANRGMAYAWKGDTDQATRDFALARSIDPNNLVVMRGEVLLAMNIADFNLAVARATNALVHHPDDPWTLETRADAYRRLGNIEKSDADIMRMNMLVGQANRF